VLNEPTLRGRLTIEPTHAERPEEFRADAAIINESAGPVEIDPAPLAARSLALEIEDARGEPVFLPPPPVPGRAPVAPIRLEPGAEHRATFEAFFPVWMERGRYRARLRYVGSSEQVLSEWTEFELG
jgi:hypothetical protein